MVQRSYPRHDRFHRWKEVVDQFWYCPKPGEFVGTMTESALMWVQMQQDSKYVRSHGLAEAAEGSSAPVKVPGPGQNSELAGTQVVQGSFPSHARSHGLVEAAEYSPAPVKVPGPVQDSEPAGTQLVQGSCPRLVRSHGLAEAAGYSPAPVKVPVPVQDSEPAGAQVVQGSCPRHARFHPSKELVVQFWYCPLYGEPVQTMTK